MVLLLLLVLCRDEAERRTSHKLASVSYLYWNYEYYLLEATGFIQAWANEKEVLHEYNLVSVKELPKDKFDTIVLTVAHNEFKNIDLSMFKKENAIIYDVKGILDEKADAKL